MRFVAWSGFKTLKSKLNFVSLKLCFWSKRNAPGDETAMHRKILIVYLCGTHKIWLNRFLLPVWPFFFFLHLFFLITVDNLIPYIKIFFFFWYTLLPQTINREQRRRRDSKKELKTINLKNFWNLSISRLFNEWKPLTELKNFRTFRF